MKKQSILQQYSHIRYTSIKTQNYIIAIQCHIGSCLWFLDDTYQLVNSWHTRENISGLECLQWSSFLGKQCVPNCKSFLMLYGKILYFDKLQRIWIRAQSAICLNSVCIFNKTSRPRVYSSGSHYDYFTKTQCSQHFTVVIQIYSHYTSNFHSMKLTDLCTPSLIDNVLINMLYLHPIL